MKEYGRVSLGSVIQNYIVKCNVKRTSMESDIFIVASGHDAFVVFHIYTIILHESH